MCADGHRYPLVEDVPVMLVPDWRHTHSSAELTLEAVARKPERHDVRYAGTLRAGAVNGHPSADNEIDPVVSALVGATSGLGYRHLVGRLTSYPIPELPLPPGRDRTLLDLGCGWGRWTMAAAAGGYRAVGIDPCLGAVLAAKRVARQLGLEISLVCGDARHVPFTAHSFDVVFSYSVLQHFCEEDATATFHEISRVLRPGGLSKIQMANRGGMRSLYHQARRRWRSPRAFEVRYWRLSDLKATCEAAIGQSGIAAEAFGGLGLLWCDRDLLRWPARAVVTVSERLRRLSLKFPALTIAADSVFVESGRDLGT